MTKIRVVVVDDSVVMRKLITTALSQDPGIEVIGHAPDGLAALERVARLNPDVLTLDVEMPGMDGIATLREIRKTRPSLPVVMVSAHTKQGAAATISALMAGANDYVTKPVGEQDIVGSLELLQRQLVPLLKALCARGRPVAVAPVRVPTVTAVAPSLPVLASGPKLALPIRAVCIGISTGGPQALTAMLPGVPGDFEVPILIVQHMPPIFTKTFAESLAHICAVKVHEAVEGQVVLPGHAYIAPGGHHMEVRKLENACHVHLHDGPQENSCRPAVDVLFRSASAVYGGSLLAVVMTGMGYDGLRGAEVVRAGGGRVMAQDEATSVVWGMPGAVAHGGLAEKLLPLSQIASEITQTVRRSFALARSTGGPGRFAGQQAA